MHIFKILNNLQNVKAIIVCNILLFVLIFPLEHIYNTNSYLKSRHFGYVFCTVLFFFLVMVINKKGCGHFSTAFNRLHIFIFTVFVYRDKFYIVIVADNFFIAAKFF